LGKKTPYGQIFINVFQTPHRPRGNASFCANFVKFGRPEVGEIARYLMDKKNKISALPPEAASARIAHIGLKFKQLNIIILSNFLRRLLTLICISLAYGNN